MATFFASSRVKIFPCYNRGELISVTETETIVQPIDPESKLSTEYNFTHIPGLFMGYDSYTIENTSQIFRGVIHGYYIEIAHGTNQTLDGKLVICEYTYPIYKTLDEDRTTTRLAPINILSSFDSASTGTKDKLGYRSDQVELDAEGKCIAVAYIAGNAPQYELSSPEAANFYSLDLADEYRKIVTFTPNSSYPDNTVHSLKLIEDLRTTATSGFEGAKDYVDDAVEALYGGNGIPSANALTLTDLNDTLSGLDDRLDVVQGDEDKEGSIAKALADAKAYTDEREFEINKYADQAETDAKAYTDEVAGNYYVPAVGEEDAEGYVPAKEAYGLRGEIAAAVDAAVDQAKIDLVGADTDTTYAKTIKGAKDYAANLNATMSTRIEDIKEIIGTSDNAKDDETIYGAIAAETAAREEADTLINEKFGAKYSKEATVAAAIADVRKDLDTLTGKDGDGDTTNVNGLRVRMSDAEGDIDDLEAEFADGGRVKVAENKIFALEAADKAIEETLGKKLATATFNSFKSNHENGHASSAADITSEINTAITTKIGDIGTGTVASRLEAADQAAADAAGAASTAGQAIDDHKAGKNNPHEVTKAQVGLGNVDNKSVADIKTEFTGAIAEDSTDFVTGGAVYAADKALDDRLATVEAKLTNVFNVMDFVGAAEALPAEGSNQNGDVIVITAGDNAGKEFVYDDSKEAGKKWVEFGSTSASDAATTELTARVTTAEGEIDTLQNLTDDITIAIEDVNKNLQDNYLSKADVEGNILGVYAIAFDLSTYSGDPKDLSSDFKAATSTPIVFISRCSKLPGPPAGYGWFDNPNEGTQVVEENITKNIILYLKAIQEEAPETIE